MADKSLIAPEDLRKLIRYDSETGEMFWRERSREWFATNRSHVVWNTRYAGNRCFHKPDNRGYAGGKVVGHNLLGHRIAWALHHGKWPAAEIDHLNGDRMDNRIANLRAVNFGENCKNQKRSLRNTSGVTGVHFNRNLQVWIASIKHCGRAVHLGCFKNFADAVSARKAAEVTYGYHPNHGRPG